MLEQPRQQQDESMGQLQKRMAALEQENTLLKQRLADLSELEQRYRLLQSRERIFEAIICASNALLTIENFDQAVNTALQIIGEKLDSDRVTVIENVDSPSEQLPRWKVVYEWHSPHTVPQISHPHVAQGSYEEIKEWYALFSQGEGVSCLLEEMPEPFRDGQAELGVKAFHIVPIFVDGKCWGVVGFDDCREAKRRSLAELALLKTVAACIGSAIRSDRTQQALLRAEQERATQLEQINAELRQALDRLAESEERFRTLFELSSEGFNYVEFDPPYSVTLPIEEQCELYRNNLRVVKVNPAFAAMYGVDNPDDLIGLKIADVHVENSEKNAAFIRAIVENGYRARNIETEEIDRHGNRLYFLNSGVVTIKDNYVVNGWGTQVDITQLRQIQQALLRAEQERTAALERINAELRQALDQLAESEERFRTLFELSNEGFYYTEIDPPLPVTLPIEEQCELIYRNVRVVKANPAFAAMYGVENPDELIGLRNSDVHVPGSEKNTAFIRAQVENGYRIRNVETEEIDSQGRLRYFLNSGVATLKDGYVVGCWATQVDITELRETQQALLQAEQQRAAELAKVNEELRQRDRLLSTVAQITRDLLEAEDLNLVIARILLAIGEAANMSRVQLILEHQDPSTQKRQHIIAYEWVAAGITPQIDNPDLAIVDNDDIEVLVQELYAGRSFWRIVDDLPDIIRMKFSSIGIKSTGTVPILIEGRYIGCVAFDDCVTPRHWSQQEIDVLAAAAESIGAALHRKQLIERLIEERTKAAQERAAELAKANHALRESLRSLATNPELDTFLGYLLLEMATQIDAVKNYLFFYDRSTEILSLHTFVRDGKVFSKEARDFEPFAQPIPADTIGVWRQMIQQKSPLNLALEQDHPSCWPGTYEWHRAQGHQGILGVPLILGEEPLGFLGLAFTQKAMLSPQEIELAQALAHQVTLAIQLTRLAEESRQAAILEERNRMAREIHDTLAQAFAGIGIQLQAANRFRTTNPDKAQIHWDRAYALAQTGLTEARRSVWALSQEGLEYSDLSASVTRIAEQLTAETSLQASIEVQGTPYSVEPEVGLNLLRIAQEALTNAIRHAQAQNIQIQITYEPSYLRLRVQDDGRGFNPQLPVKGFGLASMQQRADHIGAQLLVSSQLGAGTEIAIIVAMAE